MLRKYKFTTADEKFTNKTDTQIANLIRTRLYKIKTVELETQYGLPDSFLLHIDNKNKIITIAQKFDGVFVHVADIKASGVVANTNYLTSRGLDLCIALWNMLVETLIFTDDLENVGQA